MRSLFIATCYASFLVVGIVAPFALSLGYLWFNSFMPQVVAFGLMNELPTGPIMAVAAFGGYFLLDRRDPPRLCLATVLLLLFASWTTLSTFGWAVVPGDAFEKWSDVIKTILFTAFIPLAIRSRIQIEAFL